MLRSSFINFVVLILLLCTVQKALALHKAKACPSFSVTETVLFPVPTTPQSLSPCTEYKFVYQLCIPGGPSNEHITINLPAGITYTGFVAYNPSGATVVNTAGGTSPEFDVSGWGSSTLATFTITVHTPSVCGSSIGGLTVASGPTVGSASPLASLQINPPVLLATNAFSGTQLLNTGDVTETVFRLENTSTNGAGIPNIDLNFTLPDPTDSMYHNYYISTSPTAVMANFYTYAPPLASFGSVSAYHPFSGSVIHLSGSDFMEFCGGSTVLTQSHVIYVHIPFKAKVCGIDTGGRCAISWGCGGSPCFSVNETFNATIQNGTPLLQVTGYPSFSNATFCPSLSPNTSTIGFTYTNMGNPAPSPIPAGASRAVSIKLALYSNTNFGTLDPNSFQLHFGSNTLSLAGFPVAVAPVLTLGDPYESYTIDLSDLHASLVGWDPLGAGTLADLDGDGSVDDLAEGGAFTITADFHYNTASCPLTTACAAGRKNIPYIIAAYNDQCDTTPPVIPPPNGYGNGQYYYETTGGSANISAPADVVEGIPFTIDLCTAPYYQRWAPVGLEICPNGYHQVKLNLPLGYHLNPAALIPLGGGVYQLNHSIAALPSGCSGLPVNITPELQEFCGSGPTDPSYVIITFGGQLPIGNCSGYYDQTYMLDCIDSVPLLLDCPGTGGLCPTVPANFGADNISFDLEYVCDASCSSCVSGIACGGTSTYHHCNGMCDSYFNTMPNSFTFVRVNHGTNNPGPSSTCSLGSGLTDPTVIDTLAAYPGDSIVVNLKGQFIPDPPTTAPHIGVDFQEIQMQIRYDNLPSGQAATYDLFDYVGGQMLITNPVTFATLPIPAGDITYTPFLNSANIVEMNFKLPAYARAWMNDNTVGQYDLEAEIYLKAKATPPAVIWNTTFFATNAAYPLMQLRAEFMGLLSNPPPADPDTIYSCDSWGTHFTMLQPREAVTYYPGNGFNQTSTCDPYPVQFMFESIGARYTALEDDFPYEYRPYARLDSVVEITLPPGYEHVSSTFFILQSPLGPGPNGFGAVPPVQGYTYTVSGMTFSTSAAGTTIRYSGISGGGSCWPLLDDKYSSYYPFHSIVVLMQPSCTAPDSAHFEFKGSYTEGIQQPNPAYQVQTHFDLNSVLPVYHINPIVTLPPFGTVNVYGNVATFTFNLCDAVANANHPWIAIENSMLDALDLSSAGLVQTAPTAATYTPSFYTDANGHTALLFNLNAIPLTDICHAFTFTATVNSNGCIPANSPPELDHLTVTYGNECSGDTIEVPDSSCIQGTTIFYFKRYPSNIEMDLTASPPAPVDLCDGILHYEFEIESSDIGTITDPDFLLDLPPGISLVDISFVYPYDNPSPPVVLTGPDVTLPTGELLWNIEPHVSLSNVHELPGTSSDADSTKIKVILNLQTSCTYNATDYINFYAGGISSCSDSLITPAIQNRPVIHDAVPFDNLSVQVAMSTSDSDPGLNCNNVATFTITVINNNTGASNQHDEVLTVTIPGAPLTVSNAGGFTVVGSTLTLPIPLGTLPSGPSGTTTYTFEVVLGSNVYCQTHLPVAAVISFSETVDCTESGGSCNMAYSSEPDSLFIDACCPCMIDLGPDSTICIGTSVSLDATVSGSATYSWSPATDLSCTTCANPIATPAVTTTYTVTATMAEGICADEITIVVNPVPIVTVNSATVCVGQSTSLIASGASTYTWNPSGTLSSSTGTTVTATPSSTTVYTVTGTDENGCDGSATSTVTVNPLPVVTIGSNSPVCVGSTLNLTSSGGGTYAWNGPGGFSSSLQNPSISGATAAASGTYTVTVTDGNGCVNSGTVAVAVNALPSVTIGSNSPICVGSTLNLTSSGGGTYVWTGPGSFSSSLQNPSIPGVTAAATGTYTVTVTGTNGCINSATTAVIVNELPVVTVNSATVCAGQSTVLTAGGATTYTWSPSGTLSSSTGTTVTATPSSTTVYTISGTDANGCIGSTTSTVTVNPLPVVTIGSNSPVCVGATSNLTSSGGGTYAWGGPGSFTSTLQNPSITSVTAGAAGTYTVTVTGANGCVNSATTSVVVNPLPVVTIGSNSPLCAGATLNLTSSGGGTYAWSGPGSFTSTLQNPSIPSVTAAAGGTYTVTVTSASGCVASATTAVVVNPAPTLTVTTDTDSICKGVYAHLLVSGASTYTWTPGTGLSCTNCTNPTAGPASTVTYTVTGTDANGCVGSATMLITVFTPTISLTPLTSSICVGANVVLSAFGSLVTSYEWYSLPPPVLVGTGTSYTVSGTSAGTFMYQVVGYTNIPGCKAAKTATVTVHPLPTITATPSVTICPDVVAHLTAGGAGVGGSYSWAPPTGLSCPTCASTNASPVSDITYTVTGTDAFGCQNTATSFVHVIPTPTITVNPALSYTICPGGPLSFTATGSGITSYNWYNTTPPPPDVYMGSSASQTVTPTTNSTYVVQGSVSEGCAASATVTVNVISPPVISGCHDINCGESITLTASGTGTFTWTPVAGSGATMTDYPAASTTYTVTGACGLQATCTVSVTPAGSLTWPKIAGTGSTSFNEITDVIQNSSGDTYVVGNYWGTVVVGTYTLTNSAPLIMSTFVAKFSDCGVEWAKKLYSTTSTSTTPHTYGKAITLDANEDPVITGSYYGALNLPAMSGYTTILTSGSRRLAYVVRINRNSGESMEAVQNGATGLTTYEAEGNGIAYKNGFIYVSGYANSGISFGTLPFVSIPSNDRDIFVVKLNGTTFGTPAGTWIRKFGYFSNTQYDGPETEVSVDNSNNVYVGTSIYSQVTFAGGLAGAGGSFMQGFVGRYTSTGTEDTRFAFGNTTNDTRLNDLVVDNPGNVFVTGSWQGIIQGPSGTVPPTTYNSSYDRDIYMAKLHKPGVGAVFAVDWLKRGIGFGTDDGRGVSIDAGGANAYFTGKITFPGAFEGFSPLPGVHNGGEAYVYKAAAGAGTPVYVNASSTNPSTNFNFTYGNTINSNSNGSTVVFAGGYLIPAGPTGNVVFNSTINSAAPNNPVFFAARANGSGTFYRLAGATEEDGPKVVDDGPLQLFPNPNNGTFMLQFKDHKISSSRIEIYDGQGKKVLAETNPVSDDQVELNLKEISEGVYMVMVWQDGEVFSKRVVIMK